MLNESKNREDLEVQTPRDVWDAIQIKFNDYSFEYINPFANDRARLVGVRTLNPQDSPLDKERKQIRSARWLQDKWRVLEKDCEMPLTRYKASGSNNPNFDDFCAGKSMVSFYYHVMKDLLNGSSRTDENGTETILTSITPSVTSSGISSSTKKRKRLEDNLEKLTETVCSLVGGEQNEDPNLREASEAIGRMASSFELLVGHLMGTGESTPIRRRHT